MGDNNWDLGAVVRKWNNRPTRDNTNNNVGTEPVVPSLGLESVTFEKDDDWFNDYLSAIDDDSSDTFEGLSLMFSSDDFPVAQQQTPVIQSPNSIITNPTSFPFAVDVQKDQNETQPQLLQPIQTALLSQQMFPPPPPPPPPPAVAMSAPAPQQMIPRRKPGRPPKRAKVFPSVTVPVARNSRVIKTRKRKNSPLLKVVREMTYDELLNDKWAWRKYGQKPIRGTPYPRNYYRCSTDKYCIARKYLERSPRDPSLFIVSLYGEHSHEPPANINSLSGSTRSTKSIKDLSTVPDPTPSSYSSPSPVSGSSFSPVSPMTPMFDTESALPNKNHMMEQAEEEENKGGNEEENIDLIPNDFMIEDIFMSFEELEGSAYNNFGKGRFF